MTRALAGRRSKLLGPRFDLERCLFGRGVAASLQGPGLPMARCSAPDPAAREGGAPASRPREEAWHVVSLPQGARCEFGSSP